MKKTVTCIAMIVSATAFAKKDDKADKREPANSNFPGYTFVSCVPAGNLYQGSEAYKNACLVPLMDVEVPAGGMQRGTTTVKACDANHRMVVTANPVRYICLPPGAVEL